MPHRTQTDNSRRWLPVASVALMGALMLARQVLSQEPAPTAALQPAKAADAKDGKDANDSSEPASDPELPAPLKAYKGRQIADTMHFAGAGWLMHNVREREEDCSLLLDALGLKTGQTVCDMGCGNGFYSLKMAKLVGDQGQVIGVDIQPEMLKMLEARAKDDDVKNIKLVHGGPGNPRLADASVDLILLVDVYHEFSYPEHMLRAMRKSLKPGGRIALAEFRLEDRNVPIKVLHKMTKKQIRKEFEPNGFVLVEEFDRLPWQHLMFFMRNDDPAAKPVKKSSKAASNAGDDAKPDSAKPADE